MPIIVTIFLIYFALPALIDVRLNAFTAATVGLILWGSAQVAEATRGAVQSIPREQHEASAALGFGWVGRHRHVILPQALRRLLPPLVSLLVNVIQNTTHRGDHRRGRGARGRQQIGRAADVHDVRESHAFEIFAGVMAIFFVISFPLTRLAAYLERRLV